jgi:hypothetical protein
MENMNNDGTENNFWQQCSEAEVQVYSEIAGQLVQKDIDMENFGP